jgi:hypothetical protein
MKSSAITATPEPEATDPPAGHTQMTNIVDSLDRFVVGRFATRSALTVAIPSPTEGMVAYVADTGSFSKPALMVWMAGAWISLEALLTRQFSFLDVLDNLSLTSGAGLEPTLPSVNSNWRRVASHFNLWSPPFPVRMHLQGTGLFINHVNTFPNQNEIGIRYLRSDNSAPITQVWQWAGTNQNYQRFTCDMQDSANTIASSGVADFTAGQQAGYHFEWIVRSPGTYYVQMATKVWFEALGVP